MERCEYCGKYHEDWESYASITTTRIVVGKKLYCCSKACTLNDPNYSMYKEEMVQDRLAELARSRRQGEKFRE